MRRARPLVGELAAVFTQEKVNGTAQTERSFGEELYSTYRKEEWQRFGFTALARRLVASVVRLCGWLRDRMPFNFVQICFQVTEF